MFILVYKLRGDHPQIFSVVASRLSVLSRWRVRHLNPAVSYDWRVCDGSDGNWVDSSPEAWRTISAVPEKADLVLIGRAI